MARPNAFSAYANHFINASTAFNRSLYREAEEPEPIFFSVTEGSHLAQSKDSIGEGPTNRDDEGSDLDDDGLPRLFGSDGSILRSTTARRQHADEDMHQAGPSSVRRPSAPTHVIEDPYLDETEIDEDLGSPDAAASIPLIASRARSPEQRGASLAPAPAPGWLAHFSQTRQQSPMKGRAHPPDSPQTSTSGSSPPSRRVSDSSDPPPFLDHLPVSLPPPSRTTLSESLLPRDGVSRPLFNLPDSHRVPRRKYNDSLWTAFWCTCLLVCGIGSIVVLFVTVSTPNPLPGTPRSPYSTITRAIPLLTFIVILSSGLSYVHLLLLRYAVRPMLIFTGLIIPLCLFLASTWSFAGSFDYSESVAPTWGETVGLRIFSILPLVMAVLSARWLYYRQKAILRTVSIIELSTNVVLQNLPLLGLSLCLLLGALVASLPFLSLILRLTLIGYSTTSGSDKGWHIRGYAGWMAFLATCIWLWSWSIVRGMLKVTVGGVVGSWYFLSAGPEPARLTSMKATELAFARANGPSLGSVCVSTAILTITRSTIFVLRTLRRLTTPPQLAFLAPLHPLEWLSTPILILDSLSNYTLVYVGLTGEPFWAGTRRAKELINGRTPGGVRTIDYSLISSLLTWSSLSLAALSAVGGYIFAAHTLADAGNAGLMALLTGGVTFMTVNFAVGVVEDAADTLFSCYRMDIASGTRHSLEVFNVLEGNRAAPVDEP